MPDKQLWPYGIYNLKTCTIEHLGLYFNEDDIWRTYLGWPDKAEIEDAKKRGYRAIQVTIQYDPPRS